MSEQHQKKTRVVGPRFPFISLQKALERCEEFRRVAGDHVILAPDARKAWGYRDNSSGGDQTIAALRYYGLLEREGKGRIRLTDSAKRYLRDERPEIRAELRRQLAFQPRVLRELWNDWKNDPPPDIAARSILKVDRGFPDKAAEEVLRIYRDNLAFVGAPSSGILPTESTASDEHDGADEREEFSPVTVKVGDYVQWTPGGVDQFKVPGRVVWVSDDASHVRIHGSPTGIPVAEVTVTDPPTAPPVGEKKGDRVIANSAWVQGANELNVLQRGSRLEITADVDLEGLQNLKEVLTHYEKILELLSPRKSDQGNDPQ